MLKKLSVENYALIDRLDMEFGVGLNTVTGETGAGKSILLGALGLLLGTRGEAGVQKDPSRSCVVEGVFSLDGYGLDGFFADNDLEYSPEIVVRRIVSTSGKSRAYVDDLPVGLGVLRELGDRLIDIHSQHENLLIRSEGFRVGVLDGVAGQEGLMKRYVEVFAAWRETLKRLAEARRAAEETRRDEEWLRHQATELAATRLVAGEQELLEAEQRELSHSDEIGEAFGFSVGELAADETGILSRVKALRLAVERVGGIHPRAEEFAARLESVYVELQDLEREMAAERERVEGNPERLGFVVGRLDAIYALQQKHRVGSVEELLAVQASFEERLAAIDLGEERMAELEASADRNEAESRELAARLSEGRRGAAGAVSDSVVAMLRRLGMAEARFVVELSSVGDLRANGGDEVRFLFSSVGAMPPRPVEKIASGGEISRVMLALKSLSARSGGRPTVIFDEIDAGVSGRVADAMGDIIAELARGCQVVNITHLPQIAAKGENHFLVYKRDGSTRIRPLSADERVTEIAGMLSGSEITAAALKQAEELLS
ncbi:MAG: DNA repair protein RecN [Alistipes sp.]|jgi:DNA repair protein RecN (Recombination protein N)|nr:DNA repair protein RecN [Alistipes sp.]